MREEFLGALEPFRDEILNLFQSTYRLGALDDRQVADVIRRPAEFFNGGCDSDLLGALIQDLKPAESQPVSGAVDLPMLQIVCEQLWTEAQKQGDRRLTRELYTAMGGAQKVLEDWVARAMPPSWDEQVLTARMMLLLAPSSGLKMSFSAVDLAKGLDSEVQLVEAVLKRLSGSTRPVLRQRAYRGALAYELQHDALIKVLRPWRDEILQNADVMRQRASAQRTRRIRAAVLAAGALFVFLASILFVLWRGTVRTEQTRAVENLIRQVTDRLQLAPAEAVLLGVAAHELARRSGTNEALRERAEQHLREALVAIGRVSFLSDLDMSGAAVDRDASTLAGSTGTSLQIWKVGRPASPPIELEPRSGLRIVSWALSSDGGWAAIADEKSCVSIWRIGERAQPVREDECVAPGLVKPLTFSADGKRLAVGIDRVGLELWSIQPRLERTRLPVPDSAGIEVLALVFSRDSQTLLAGITTPLGRNSRGRLLRWHVGAAGRVPDPETPWQDDNAETSYQGIAIGDDGRWLADVDQRGTLRVWELSSAGKMTGPLIDMPHRDIRTVAFAGQGPRLALGRMGMGDRTIAVWNVATRTEERVLRGHAGAVSSVSLTAARWLASVAEKEVRLWDLDDPSAEPRILASSLGGPTSCSGRTSRGVSFKRTRAPFVKWTSVREGPRRPWLRAPRPMPPCKR